MLCGKTCLYQSNQLLAVLFDWSLYILNCLISGLVGEPVRLFPRQQRIHRMAEKRRAMLLQGYGLLSVTYHTVLQF